MRRVTAVRAERGGRVVVELDGAPWRTFPLEVVGRTGLRPGLALDRPLARRLGRELRRAEALAAATRTLRARDLPEGLLRERLARAGVPPAARDQAVETLTRAGYVDDARFARNRAAALAARGSGDAAIEAELERQGLDPELIAAALGELEPEVERARRVAERSGGGVRAARLLARRGFGEEAVEAALSGNVASDL